MQKNSINILMTGAGAPGAAGILHCLKQEPSVQVVTADANPGAVGRFLSKDFECIPFGDSPQFIDAVLSLCRKKNIHVLLPLVTKELIPLSKHVKEFELAGVRVIVSPTASLEIANNKSRLYEFLHNRNIPVPQFKVVSTIEEFRNATEELGYPRKTICFKPSVGNGSRGFRVITEHINELELLLEHKPNSVYMNLKDAIRILSQGNFPELLVSEYLPAEEYSVDCLANNGNAVVIIPRTRKKMINGISVEGEFVQDDQIIAYAERIIKDLQLHGNIGIQVKISAGGMPLILEINPRVQGTISSALGAGVNVPVLAIKQELGLPIDSSELQVKWGVKFSRYWTEVFY
jgi:carbamoyl-phosphate synthase large subunit